MSALSLDTRVSLFEPAAAPPGPQARRGLPHRIRTAPPARPAAGTAIPAPPTAATPTAATPTAATPTAATPTAATPTAATPTADRAEPTAAPQSHGRRAARPAAPRARRASAASTFSPAVLVSIGRLVAVRSLGIGLAAAAVTFALASKDAGTDAAVVSSLSVRGLAAAAILGAAWGFQDRPRLGTLQTVRAWYGTAIVIGAAHASWIEATAPRAPDARLAAALSAFALDAVLVAIPALLGARAGRPDMPSTLA